MTHRLSLWGLMIFALALGLAAHAQQTDNHALHAVPASGKVVIDGKLADWDLSGQIDVFASFKQRQTYSAKVAAMYDKDNFYLAVLWRDPTPMYNMVDSRFDIGSGWKSDCLQLRLKTDMIIASVDCWYSTAAQHPVINLSYGRYSGGRAADDVNAFQAVSDALRVGAQQAFQMGEDGKSYTQEIALPWRFITGQGAIVKATGKPYKEPMTFKAGDRFQMGMEFLWGPADGRTFPVHRYADLLQEGTSSREFFWTADKAWGPVMLEPKGNLQLPKPDYAASTAYLQATEGPVKLQYTMPYDGCVTLVIEDEKGRRVKNLVGMAPRTKGKQVDLWDGTDDAGKLVAPGAYRWRGLYHQGIDPTYEASYGTPGTPPWDTGDNTGAWMSDHNAPVVVAAGKERVFLGAGGSEAGWALIGVDYAGKRLFGERKFQGLTDLAVDEKYLYGAMNQWWDKETPMAVGRLEVADGKYAPFATTPAPQLIVAVAEKGEKGTLVGLDVTTDRLAVAIAGLDVVRFFEKSTMARLGHVAVPGVGQVAYDTRGTLYAIAGTGIVKVVGDTVTPVVTAGLEQPRGLATDAQGRLYVSDRGSNQVKLFSADGKLVKAIGVAGGRPVPGKWVANGMANPAGLDVDAQGRIWVAEEMMFPKRISVWSVDGQLLVDYIGPTTYGGMGACVDPDDKTRLFGNGCEFKLDYAANKATVVANLIDDNLVGDLVKIQGREYFLAKRGALYLRQGDAFKPVAQMGSIQVRELAKSGVPVQAPAGAKDWFSYVWSDLNDDRQMQAAECQTTLAALNGGYWGGFWLDERFHLYSGPGGYVRQTVSKIPLKGWTAGGAPIWDIAHLQTIANRDADGPNKLYLASGGTVIVGSPLTCLADDGTVLWSYGRDMWCDVHGSHNAPVPERDDQFVGTLSCIGKAETPLGPVFAMNSNMGRLFLMTTDGLLVGSVFQDCRIGPDSWPTSAKVGSPMGGVTMGGEWFGGYFFKANKTNEYYLIAGGTSYNLLKLNGLEKMTRLPGGALAFGGRELQAAEKLLQQRAAVAAQAKALTIARLATAPKVDGKIDEYAKERFVAWSSGNYQVKAAVAADATSLYLAYDVSNDATPMVNAGQDATHLFITGDSVDLQLGTDPAANPKRTEPAVGDLRLLISVVNNQPVAVLYRWKSAGQKQPKVFTSPWRTYTAEYVAQLTDAQLGLVRRGNGYTVEAAIPLATLGFAPQAGKAYKLDLGAIFSDATGTNRAARVYWANKATGLVNDVPGEIMATPNLWGTATAE
jgi:hypothetical protein